MKQEDNKRLENEGLPVYPSTEKIEEVSPGVCVLGGRGGSMDQVSQSTNFTIAKSPAVNERRQPGRKCPLDNPAVQRKLLAAASTGCTIRAACAAAGVSKSALYRWLEKPENGTFEASLTRARDASELRYLAILAKAAQGGELVRESSFTRRNGDVVTVQEFSAPDSRAAMFILERRVPEYRRRAAIELDAGSDAGKRLTITEIGCEAQ